MNAASENQIAAARERFKSIAASKNVSEARFGDVLAIGGRGVGGVTGPSDLIGGVLAAADPDMAQESRDRLTSMANAAVSSRGHGGLDSVSRNFEAVLLRNMLESILPKEETGAFGEGLAGSIWRSFAADHMASLFSDAGGIGLAEAIEAHLPQAGAREDRAAQWPYFGATTIRSFVG